MFEPEPDVGDAQISSGRFAPFAGSTWASTAAFWGIANKQFGIRTYPAPTFIFWFCGDIDKNCTETISFKKSANTMEVASR